MTAHATQKSGRETGQKIAACLWFDGQAEEAARFYTTVFPDSKILSDSRYGEAGREIHGQEAGTVMTVEFELSGQRFTALNGGPQFKFNEAISFQVDCETQDEVNYYWEKLSDGGDPSAQQCGWLKDRFGLSWQVVPRIVAELLSDPDRERANRATDALLKMKKIEIAELERAVEPVGSGKR